MKLVRGTSFENPIDVEQKKIDKGEINVSIETTMEEGFNYPSFDIFANILQSLFGTNDADYFILGECTAVSKGYDFRVFYVEDKDGEKHNVFFRIIK